MSVLNTTHQAAPASPPRDLTIKVDEKDNLNVILEWQTPKLNSGGITGIFTIMLFNIIKYKAI